MGILAVIIIAVIAFVLLAKSGMDTEIQKCRSVQDIVKAISYGRVHPYYIGMSLNDVKYTVKRLHSNIDKFENDLSIYELMGRVPSVDIPKFSSLCIERITLGFNGDNRVDSITIDLKHFHAISKDFLKELNAKFGNPMSISSEFIIWRNREKVINLSKDGSIMIFDESLKNF